MNGRAEVIIWNNASGISIYYEHVTLEVDKIESGIIVRLNPKGLEGVTIRVPDAFRKTMSEEKYRRLIRKVLKALRAVYGDEFTVNVHKAAST